MGQVGSRDFTSLLPFVQVRVDIGHVHCVGASTAMTVELLLSLHAPDYCRIYRPRQFQLIASDTTADKASVVGALVI